MDLVWSTLSCAVSRDRSLSRSETGSDGTDGPSASASQISIHLSQYVNAKGFLNSALWHRWLEVVIISLKDQINWQLLENIEPQIPRLWTCSSSFVCPSWASWSWNFSRLSNTCQTLNCSKYDQPLRVDWWHCNWIHYLGVFSSKELITGFAGDVFTRSAQCTHR